MLGMFPLGSTFLGSASLQPAELSPKLPQVLAQDLVAPVYLACINVGKFLPYWQAHSATAWKVAETDRVVGIKVNGVTLAQVNSVAEVEALPGSFYWDRQEVFVQLPGNADPRDVDQVVQAQLKFYFASETVTLNGICWEGRIKQLPSISLRIEDEFSDISQISGGKITLVNTDGFFDARFSYQWDAGTTELFMGAEGLDFFDYIKYATFENITPDTDDEDFTLKLQELKGRATRDVPTRFYTRAEYPGMNQQTEGEPKQLAYGTILGAKPVVIDRAARRFKVAEHAIRAFQGVKVLTNETWNAVSFESTDLVNGEFTLAAVDWDGDQSVSVDFQGRVLANGELMDNAADIIQDLLVQVGETRLDTASFNAAHDFLDAGYVFQNENRRLTVRVPSLYINERTSLLNILGRINMVVGSYLVTNPDGQHSYKIFDQQRGQVVPTFDETEIIDGSFNITVKEGQEVSKVVANFAARPQEDANQVIELERPKNQYIRNETDPVVITLDLDTVDRDSARRVAERVLTLSEWQPIRYKVKVKWRAFVLKVADQVRIRYPRHNIDLVAEVLEWKPRIGDKSEVELTLGNLHGFSDISGFWVESTETTPAGGTLDWNTVDRIFKRQNSGHWHSQQDFAVAAPTGPEDYKTSVWSG